MRVWQGGFLLNLGTHRATEMKVDWSATCMPGHTRRPNPKGIVKSLSTLPFQFPAGLCGVRNREGSNVSGSSNRFGSLTSTLGSWRQISSEIVQKETSKRTRCYRTRLRLSGYRIRHTHRLWSSHVVCLAEPQGAICMCNRWCQH